MCLSISSSYTLEPLEELHNCWGLGSTPRHGTLTGGWTHTLMD